MNIQEIHFGKTHLLRRTTTRGTTMAGETHPRREDTITHSVDQSVKKTRSGDCGAVPLEMEAETTQEQHKNECSSVSAAYFLSIE